MKKNKHERSQLKKLIKQSQTFASVKKDGELDTLKETLDKI